MPQDLEFMQRIAQFRKAIEHTIIAHSDHVKEPENAVRFQDGKTPYAIHPIWCGMTILTESKLSPDIIEHGYQALLWHDTLEDTNLPLPENIDPAVQQLVEEMTFTNFQEERQKLWIRSDVAKLLKLYDKVSNLLDGTWMNPQLREQYIDHTQKLIKFVKSRYGELNIVRIARAICEPGQRAQRTHRGARHKQANGHRQRSLK